MTLLITGIDEKREDLGVSCKYVKAQTYTFHIARAREAVDRPLTQTGKAVSFILKTKVHASLALHVTQCADCSKQKIPEKFLVATLLLFYLF